MNTFMDNLEKDSNYKLTENGAIAHKSTLSAVYDMFALGGAYRNRSDDDCITQFIKALDENEELAIKCLFYLRDIRGGQGERRYFRVCFKWLADNRFDIAKRNLEQVSEFGRWDDLIYSCADTKLEDDALEIIKHQLALDVTCQTPSLLAKWLPSENASSKETKRLGSKVRSYLGVTHKEYRKMLSILRDKIRIVETLMSQNRWDEIEFDKIPSRAGMIYRNAFARRDIIAKKYENFVKDDDVKINAKDLYPYDIAHKAFIAASLPSNSIERISIQKYWDALPNFYNKNEENGLCIVDVSGSMWGKPLEAAVSLGAYISEHGHGPFANHFITFSSEPELVAFEGVDITDKFNRCKSANWGMNTNIEAVFDLLLKVAKEKNTLPEDIPSRLYILSDMEFDYCLSTNKFTCTNEGEILTSLESIAKKWESFGYELPQVIFWNLNARQDTIPAFGKRFAYISGLSPVIIETILDGKDGYDLMLTKLLSERYNLIK